MSDSDSDSDSDIDLPQPLPAIHAAVRNLDVDALRRALAAGASIEETDVAGWTPLYRACKNRVYGVITRTVPKYWNKRISDRVAMVRALLENGASVHARCDDDDDTPLLAAVMNEEFPSNDIVEMLIAAGADIEAADNADFCVLYAAAQRGRADTVARLLAAGADPHRIHPVCGYTALDGATATHNYRTYAPLIRAGATLPPESRRNAYLKKIATPGGYPAYERAHRTRLAAIFVPKLPRLPVEVIHHIVSIWADCGGH